MISLKNYWETTSPKLKKFGLLIKGLIATAAGSAYVQNDVKMAFYCLIGGGLLTGLLELFPPEKPADTPKPPQGGPGSAGVTAVILAMITAGFMSCQVIKPTVKDVQKDSTTITYKPTLINYQGAKVTAGLNLDSLFKAAASVRAQHVKDSTTYAALYLRYQRDSTAAVIAGKPLPAAPKPPAPNPKIQYVTDPQTKAQLSYWVDQYGKLQLGCESKSQQLTALTKEVTRLQQQIKTTTDVAFKTPVWNWVAMAGEGVLLLITGLLLQFGKELK